MNQDFFGFIGVGNMGGALAEAAAKKVPADCILLANRSQEKASALAGKLGCTVADNRLVAEKCRYIFLGVKPQMMADMLSPLKDVFASRTDRFVLVTMAAGLSTDAIAEMAGGNYPVIRIMPNTPASVGRGVILLCANENVTPEELAALSDALAEAGLIDRIDEKLIDAGSAVSGCGPAFVYQFIEAMADGGVACGLPRSKALLYAEKTLEGSAYLAASSGKHPGVLKDEVCSPAGSTIQGVRRLEEGSFRADVMDAVIAAFQKTNELGKK